MPLTKCPHCGKMIPNVFGAYHKKVQCRVLRGLPKIDNSIKKNTYKGVKQFLRYDDKQTLLEGGE